MLLVQILGWAGAVLTVVAFALLTAGRLTPRGRVYVLMNIVGGAFLFVNAAFAHAWPSVAVNLVWLVVAVAGTLRRPAAAAPQDQAVAPD